MRICLVGEGGQGEVYMKAFGATPGVEVTALTGGNADATEAFAKNHGIGFWSTDLEACLARNDVDAVVIGSPTQLHMAQAEATLKAGKHCLLEIPMTDRAEDAQRLADLEEETGLTCMVAHTRRYQPMMREVMRQVREGELTLHHIVFQTYFFRRTNLNRDGNPRTWADNLLWHHACHSVDLAVALNGEPDSVWGQCGPDHSVVGIPMDITIGMKWADGKMLTGALSFNNHGPIQVSTRFIGEENTLIAVSNEAKLYDWEGNVVVEDNFQNGFRNQVAEFVEAVQESRPAATSFAECNRTMRTLGRIQDAVGRVV